MNQTNQKLLVTQKEWVKCCGADMLAEEYHLSRPFLFAITEKYHQSSRRVMVIGQEARGFGDYSIDWPIDSIHKTIEEYTNIQLKYCSPHDKMTYNRSPFWNFIRKLQKEGIEPVWNNVDKFHRIEKKDDKEITRTLTVELERKLNIPYGEDRKTLLMREVEISAPNIVIFVTGPYYHETMALSLKVDDKKLFSFRPQKNKPCSDITEITNLGMPVFWTYHPAYLNRIKAVDDIVNLLSNVV